MTRNGVVIVIVFALLSQIALSQESTATNKWKRRWEERIKNFPIATNSIELQLAKTFPNDEKEIFLFEAISLAHDSNWNIYVADRRNNSVVVFNSEGKYLKSFGKKGQGPGDLSFPQNIFIWNDHIVVYEAGNNRIQFFNFKGESKKIIKLFKNYHDVILSKEGIIYGVPRYIIPGTNQKMIDVIRFDGMLINSFGEPREPLLNVELGTWAGLSFINDETEILLAYMFMPIIERYSIEGALLSKALINNPVIDDDANYNINHISKGELGVRTILPAIRTHKNKTYLLHTSARVKFMELDEKFNIENSFWTVVGWNFRVLDFLIKRDEEQTTIYCIPDGSYEQMKIHVFEVKK